MAARAVRRQISLRPAAKARPAGTVSELPFLGPPFCIDHCASGPTPMGSRRAPPLRGGPLRRLARAAGAPAFVELPASGCEPRASNFGLRAANCEPRPASGQRRADPSRLVPPVDVLPDPFGGLDIA